MTICQNETEVKCPCDILVLPHSARGLQQLLLSMTDTFVVTKKLGIFEILEVLKEVSYI